MSQGSFVLCKLKKNCDEAEKRMDRDEEEPSVTPNSEIQASESRIADVSKRILGHIGS